MLTKVKPKTRPNLSHHTPEERIALLHKIVYRNQPLTINRVLRFYSANYTPGQKNHRQAIADFIQEYNEHLNQL